MLEIWGKFVEWIASDFWSSLIYIAIVLLWIVSFAKYLLPVLNSRRVLLRAVRRMKQDDLMAGSETLMGRGYAQSFWKQFLSNVKFTDDTYYSAADIEDYINEDTMINEPGRLAFLDGIPGMMVSLGILGTFIGITMGLTGFNLTNTEETMKGIQTLIPGMRYAFLTSIVGVIGSLSFQIVRMTVVGSTKKALYRFIGVYQKAASVQMVEPLTQIAGYQQEQLAYMRAMTEAMVKQLPVKIKEALEGTMAPMQRSLDNFITATSQEQVRGVDRIVTRFVDSMNESLSGQFGQLAATIELTCDWQRQTRASVEETLKGVAHVSQDIVEIQKLSQQVLAKFDVYLNKLNMAQLQVDDGYVKVAKQAGTIEEAITQQMRYFEKLAEYQDRLQSNMAQFQEAAEAMMRTTVDNSASTTNALRQLSGDMGRSADLLNSSYQQFVGGIHKELNNTFDLFDENMGNITKQLGWVISSIKESVENLPAAFDGVSHRYMEQMDHLIMTLQRAQMALDDATNAMMRADRRGG